MALAVADERLLAGENELHGSARLPDEKAQQTLDGHVFLAAEAAAEIGTLEPHPPVRQLQDFGDVTVVLEHLGAHAHGQHALTVDPADPGLGLHVDVVDERRAICVLDDDGGALEALGDVSRA